MKVRMFMVLLLCAVISLAAEGSREKNADSSGPVKVSFFVTMPGIERNLMESNDEIIVYQMAQEEIGVDIEFIHPSDANVELNLLIASGDYPDLIESNWSGYSGGIQKAYDDGIIALLNPYLEKGMAPNFTNLIKTYPRLRRDVSNDEGEILAFRRYEARAIDRPFKGFIVRQDWLEELGMEKPVTLDDFHKTLIAVKEAGLSKTVPFIGKKGQNFLLLSSAWGILQDQTFQLDSKTGKVIYGKRSNEYKEFLTTMLQWMEEALIDAESLVADEAALKSGFINGDGGVMFHFISRIVAFGDPAMEINPNFNMEAIGYPVGPAGKPFAQANFDIITMTNNQVCLSTSSKEVDAALKWVDYWYSDKGADLANWGVLGKSYKIENGQKSYIVAQDEVHKWAKGDYGTARIVEVAAALANQTPKQRAQTDTWIRNNPDYSLFLPDMINLTTAESKRVALVMGDIKTYTEETILKILMGVEDISIWDEYTANLEKMGIDEMTTIYQNAVDRYNKR